MKEHATFTDVATRVGIDFVYDNGAQGQWLMVETTGGGSGWLDYDRNGLIDLFCVQGGDPTRPPENSQPTNQLFRQLDTRQFDSVTFLSNTEDRNYGQGVCIGDFDNDGFEDIYVSNVGPDLLFQNQGDGTFQAVDCSVSSNSPKWSTSAAWSDLDLDGDLDLYVTGYAEYDLENPKLCSDAMGNRSTCHPKEVAPIPDRCFRNNGDGAFESIEQEWKLFGEGNRALGVAIFDMNLDGWPDIYVANDTTDNFLFLNQHGSDFREQAKYLGCATNGNGSPQASMGIAVGDYDRNGHIDLYVSHFYDEWNTLYQSQGKQGFIDVTTTENLAFPTMKKLGFGTVMEDFDQDGYQELIVGNGHIQDVRSRGIDFEMTSQYFSYDGRSWADCSPNAGLFFQRRMIARGIASADFDNDGDFDLSVVPQNSPLALLRNNSVGNNWLKLRLIGISSDRNGIGSYVTVRNGGNTWVKTLPGGTSFCSSHEHVLIFGLGDTSATCDITIQWPAGLVQEFSNVPTNQSIVLIEGRPSLQ